MKATDLKKLEKKIKKNAEQRFSEFIMRITNEDDVVDQLYDLATKIKENPLFLVEKTLISVPPKESKK